MAASKWLSLDGFADSFQFHKIYHIWEEEKKKKQTQYNTATVNWEALFFLLYFSAIKIDWPSKAARLTFTLGCS